jgi:hypothetical protein
MTQYKGKLVRNPTDLMLNQLDKEIPGPMYNVFGYELPTYLIRQCYRPQTAPYQDQSGDYLLEKFGGIYPFFSSDQKEWPICPGCESPLRLMFQLKDPVDPTQYVQMMVCPQFENQGCEGDTEELVPFYQFLKFSQDSSHNREIQPSQQVIDMAFKCYQLTGWEIHDETLPSEILAQYLDTLPDSEEFRKSALGGEFCDRDCTDLYNFLGPDYFKVKVATELEKLRIEPYDGFKFGGFQRQCQDYSNDDPNNLGITNYIQIGYGESFINYEYGNDGILHLDQEGKLLGDCY